MDGKDPFTYWKAPKDLQAETFKKPSAKSIANRMATWKKRVKQSNEITKASYRRKKEKINKNEKGPLLSRHATFATPPFFSKTVRKSLR